MKLRYALMLVCATNCLAQAFPRRPHYGMVPAGEQRSAVQRQDRVDRMAGHAGR